MQVQTYRKALQLHCCAAMSHRKIATLAGISTNSARKVLSVAETNQWGSGPVHG